MRKDAFLKSYVDIETKTLSKLDKNKQLDELLRDEEVIRFDSTDILEIIDYLTTQKITIRQPLYKNLIYPVLSERVTKNDLKSIKVLLQLDQHLLNYQRYTKDTQYSSFILLEKGLSISSDDIELLGFYESKTREYFNYTLHEIPSGVLYGINGATIAECDELINEVDKYEIVCNKLQFDESKLIQDCKYYYTNYKDYLLDCNKYKSFAHYLEINVTSHDNGTQQ